MHLKMGNGKPVSVIRREDGSEDRVDLGLPDDADHRVTDVHFPEDYSLGDALRDVTSTGGVWGYHSDHDAPLWVSSDNASLATLLADHYGAEKRPWRSTAAAGEPRRAAAPAASAADDDTEA